MSLTEKTIIDKIEVLENGTIQVRQATIIERDEKEIARNYHRFILMPGDNLLNQDSKIIAIANVVWTQDVINSYQNTRAARLSSINAPIVSETENSSDNT